MPARRRDDRVRPRDQPMTPAQRRPGPDQRGKDTEYDSADRDGHRHAGHRDDGQAGILHQHAGREPDVERRWHRPAPKTPGLDAPGEHVRLPEPLDEKLRRERYGLRPVPQARASDAMVSAVPSVYLEQVAVDVLARVVRE